MLANVVDINFDKRRTTNPRSATTDVPMGDELLVSFATQLAEIQNQLSYANEQNEYIKELLERNRARHASFASTSFTYPLAFSSTVPDIQYVFSSTKINPEMEAYKGTADRAEAVMVPLHKVLELGSVLLGFVCLAGISSWLLNDVPLVNPFGAMLGLLASPFFYVMGRIARR